VTWLQERLVLNDEGLSGSIHKFPSLLFLASKTNSNPSYYNGFKRGLSLDDDSLRKLVQKLPSALGVTIEDDLELRFAWLKKRLDLDDKELSKLVKTMPPILGLSIDDSLEPKLAWLKVKLKLDDTVDEMVHIYQIQAVTEAMELDQDKLKELGLARMQDLPRRERASNRLFYCSS
jgi:hypothetical protein